MTIGEVIRKYRHELGFTQEEMAARLGVSTPAVNKWENNNTQPDIGLLAPIARLLGISTDTLLSFKDDLTDEEINLFIKLLDKKLEMAAYTDVFKEASDKIREYPNCKKLIWNAATLLDAARLARNVPDSDIYDEQICEWYSDVLDSDDQMIRKSAASSLFHYYLRKENYSKAETYLCYFTPDDPDRRSRQAELFSKTGRKADAYQEYEELMLEHVNRLRVVLNALQMLYTEDENLKMSHKIVDLQGKLANAFDMGVYQEVSAGLDLAAYEKDVAATAHIMEILVNSCDTITDFTKSDLFSHLKKRSVNSDFFEKLKADLISGFCDDETFGYLKGNEYWESHKTL